MSTAIPQADGADRHPPNRCDVCSEPAIMFIQAKSLHVATYRCAKHAEDARTSYAAPDQQAWSNGQTVDISKPVGTAAAPAIVSLPGKPDMSFGGGVRAMRANSACPSCGKTTLVFAVNSIALERRGAFAKYQSERVTPETHCACVGGPAHHLIRQVAS